VHKHHGFSSWSEHFGSWSEHFTMELSEIALFETRSEFFSLSKNYCGSLLERIKHQDAITTVHLLSLFAPFAFPAEPTLTTGASRTVGYKPPALYERKLGITCSDYNTRVERHNRPNSVVCSASPVEHGAQHHNRLHNSWGAASMSTAITSFIQCVRSIWVVGRLLAFICQAKESSS
jgi:hypothetical protein